MKFKKVGIHQPNLLPYLGYFLKIKRSDTFVFLDNTEYSKSSLTRRTYIIRKDGEKAYLTIPLESYRNATAIDELKINQQFNWKADFFNLLEDSYKNSEFFEETIGFLHQTIDTFEGNHFSAFSIQLTIEICKQLQMERDFLLSSALEIEGKASQQLINIVQQAKGQIYLSGMGGKKYQDEQMFETAGIQIEYVDLFAELENGQMPNKNFMPGLSIVHQLFHFGFAATGDLLEKLA